MNEEQLQEIQRTLEAGKVPSAADMKFVFDTIVLLKTERDYAQSKLIEFKKERQAQRDAVLSFLGL